MEELLSERRTTISYKVGNVFRKYYKYAEIDDINKEKEYSIMARECGVHCPRFLGAGYDEVKKMAFSEFEYIQIKKITLNTVDRDLIKDVLKISNLFPLMQERDDGANEKMSSELLSVLPFLPDEHKEEYQELVRALSELKKEVMIHGDYSFENIGWDVEKKKLVVFDFQNAGCGLVGWDKAYLIASLGTNEYYKMIPSEFWKYIKAIVALKYGRGLRKEFEVKERKDAYEQWWGSTNSAISF